MLTIEDLTTDYGPVRAVDHVSFEVPEGSVTAVLGRQRRRQDIAAADRSPGSCGRARAP